MIVVALLTWVGYQLSAPWWFYVLLGVYALFRMVRCGIDIGKVAKDN